MVGDPHIPWQYLWNTFEILTIKLWCSEIRWSLKCDVPAFVLYCLYCLHLCRRWPKPIRHSLQTFMLVMIFKLSISLPLPFSDTFIILKHYQYLALNWPPNSDLLFQEFSLLNVEHLWTTLSFKHHQPLDSTGLDSIYAASSPLLFPPLLIIPLNWPPMPPTQTWPFFYSSQRKWHVAHSTPHRHKVASNLLYWFKVKKRRDMAVFICMRWISAASCILIASFQTVYSLSW